MKIASSYPEAREMIWQKGVDIGLDVGKLFGPKISAIVRLQNLQASMLLHHLEKNGVPLPQVMEYNNGTRILIGKDPY